MTNGCAIQIVEHCGENDFKVKKEALRKIYGDKRVSDFPLAVLCIAGAARKGKSFILNFFLDYLIHKEKFPNKAWTLNEKTRLNGFEFQEGEDRMTLGIWAWSYIFIVEGHDGKKIAVSLIDSQGTFDKDTSYEDCSAIFAMTSMFSSIMCFNVFTDLQEDKLNDFSAFIGHGKMITQNLAGSEKLFQSLVFIIRDFNIAKYLDDENGGQKYVEKQLGNVQNKDLQKVRDNLKESYERMYGFILPYPGAKVARRKTSNISEIDEEFVTNAKKMVETLLSQRNLQPKKLRSTQILCKDMFEYIPKCAKCFNDNLEFAPRAVQNVNREFMIKLEVKRAIKTYESLMDNVFVNCKTGFETKETLKLTSETNFTVIKEKIEQRIKDKSVCSEIVNKFAEEIECILPKYEAKNTLLVENEKNRLDLIKKQQQHEEQLQKEREEHMKKEAEAAAKLEKEKTEHEKQQAKLREEMEKQKRENERKQSDEISRIQAQLARIAFERDTTPQIYYLPQPYSGIGSSGGSGGSGRSSSSRDRGYTHTVGSNGRNYYHGPDGKFVSKQTYKSNK